MSLCCRLPCRDLNLKLWVSFFGFLSSFVTLDESNVFGLLYTSKINRLSLYVCSDLHRKLPYIFQQTTILLATHAPFPINLHKIEREGEATKRHPLPPTRSIYVHIYAHIDAAYTYTAPREKNARATSARACTGTFFSRRGESSS